jgi:dTDP-4-amino-4,6-dideoxy-D-galactose acyltransferase
MLEIAQLKDGNSASAFAAAALDVRLTKMDWETALLGRKIGRVEGVEAIRDVREGAEAIQRVERQAKRADFCLISARVPLDAVDAVWALQATGFHTVDTGVTFEYDLGKEGHPFAFHPAREVTIRSVTDDDVQILEASVEGLFRHSYYYVSPLFSRDEADLLHRTWITNCVRHGRADRVLIAELAGEVAGFITCRRLPDASGVIDLVGVRPTSSSRGIGKTLVRASQDCFRELGVAVIRVRTQITNLAAVNMYSSTGARLIKVDTTLIKSLADGASAA